MSYIDAGYAISLTVLVGYAGQLWLRRRRLERLADRARSASGEAAGAPTTAAGESIDTAARVETTVGA
ncbi:MAG TPA: hypothetical protein VNC61_02105 [Acidimicrobiales bacterium]|nr:hypothetical protein [Acidimicrobiales bacterium]